MNFVGPPPPGFRPYHPKGRSEAEDPCTIAAASATSPWSARRTLRLERRLRSCAPARKPCDAHSVESRAAAPVQVQRDRRAPGGLVAGKGRITPDSAYAFYVGIDWARVAAPGRGAPHPKRHTIAERSIAHIGEARAELAHPMTALLYRRPTQLRRPRRGVPGAAGALSTTYGLAPRRGILWCTSSG